MESPLERKSKREGVRRMFSNIKTEDNAETNQEKDKSENLDLKKINLEIFDCDGIYERLNEFIFKETPKNFSKNHNEYMKTKYATKSSVFEFFKKFSKLDELKRKGKFVLKTPSVNFLEAVRKYRIVPNPVGLINREGEENKILLNNLRLGDNYLNCLSHSLHISDHITEINLSKNRLTSKSMIPLIQTIRENKKLCKKVTSLNLSYNKIGKESIDQLCLFMEEKDCELSHLNLESNVLGDCLVNELCKQIVKCIPIKIRYLNLSQNNLSDACCYSIGDLVETCIFLDVLIVHSNQFKNQGASNIVSKIRKNTNLKVFDVSWNLIGNDLLDKVPKREDLLKASHDSSKLFLNLELKEIQSSMDLRKRLSPVKNSITLFAKELGELFKEMDIEMTHLDFSHNNIGLADCLHLSEEIKANHTILGVHCDGNQMTADELGFTSVMRRNDEEINRVASSQIYYKIDNEHPLIKTNVLNTRKIRAKNNCWICEGWKETKFVYKPQLHDGNVTDMVVKLYLNFENYKPFDTVFRTNHFICYRMCPPGELLFYYTVNGVPVESYGMITHKLKDAIVHQEVIEDAEPKHYIITRLAKTQVDISPNVIDPSTYKKNLRFCEPRPERKIFKRNKLRTPWTFPVSIWAMYDYQYEGDSNSYIDDVFDFDFNRCQFLKDTKTSESLNELKEILRSRYRKILDCYRYYSSLLGSNIWQISKNSLLELVNSCPGLLNETYNYNDVILQQTSVINTAVDKEERSKHKNKNLPENIVRHQFMSLLVKMAKDKYMSRNKTYESVTEAVKATFDTHYMPLFKDYDAHKWRIDRFYNEYCDNMIKAYLPVFDAVYKSWTSMKEPGRRDTWMNLDEFNSVVIQIVDNEYPVREIPISFNYSIKLQVNEIDSDRHLKMFFYEFIEAFCRVIDKYSPVPSDENPEDWTPQMKQDQHLSNKLETVMPRLIKLITHSDYKFLKEKFVMPSRDEESEHLKYDLSNPHYASIWPKIRRNPTNSNFSK